MDYWIVRANAILERLGSRHRIAWGDEQAEGLVEMLEALCARLERLEESISALETKNGWTDA